MAYISAKFEVDTLSTSNQIRVITTNVDQGIVPPPPSATYFPTDPDALQNFMVVEYVDDIVGERFSRVANLADYATLETLQLDTLVDTSVNFLTAGAVVGDLIRITLTDEELWKSDDYPSGNPFIFQIADIVSSTTVRLVTPMPCFTSSFTWQIIPINLTGTAGVTHRTGSPTGPREILVSQFSSFFRDSVSAQNFITATKASMEALATEITAGGLVDEYFTAGPTP